LFEYHQFVSVYAIVADTVKNRFNTSPIENYCNKLCVVPLKYLDPIPNYLDKNKLHTPQPSLGFSKKSTKKANLQPNHLYLWLFSLIPPKSHFLSQSIPLGIKKILAKFYPKNSKRKLDCKISI